MGGISYRFKGKKSTQAVAFLLQLSPRGRLTKAFLSKMLYDADREQLTMTGSPITGAKPISMEHGPVLSEILDMIEGKITTPFWSAHIQRADRKWLHLVQNPGSGLLTPSEKQSLVRAFHKFKDMSFGQLEDFCHSGEYPEWKDPGKGHQFPIKREEILVASGKAELIPEIEAEQAEEAYLNKLFG